MNPLARERLLAQQTRVRPLYTGLDGVAHALAGWLQRRWRGGAAQLDAERLQPRSAWREMDDARFAGQLQEAARRWRRGDANSVDILPWLAEAARRAWGKPPERETLRVVWALAAGRYVVSDVGESPHGEALALAAVLLAWRGVACAVWHVSEARAAHVLDHATPLYALAEVGAASTRVADALEVKRCAYAAQVVHVTPMCAIRDHLRALAGGAPQQPALRERLLRDWARPADAMEISALPTGAPGLLVEDADLLLGEQADAPSQILVPQHDPALLAATRLAAQLAGEMIPARHFHADSAGHDLTLLAAGEEAVRHGVSTAPSGWADAQRLGALVHAALMARCFFQPQRDYQMSASGVALQMGDESDPLGEIKRSEGMQQLLEAMLGLTQTPPRAPGPLLRRRRFVAQRRIVGGLGSDAAAAPWLWRLYGMGAERVVQGASPPSWAFVPVAGQAEKIAALAAFIQSAWGQGEAALLLFPLQPPDAPILDALRAAMPDLTPLDAEAGRRPEAEARGVYLIAGRDPWAALSTLLGGAWRGSRAALALTEPPPMLHGAVRVQSWMRRAGCAARVIQLACPQDAVISSAPPAGLGGKPWRWLLRWGQYRAQQRLRRRVWMILETEARAAHSRMAGHEWDQ
ncbi:hypothetical protein [Magnetofaba australis]|uniref:Uncharacterized protein n=1 Tax=Magnetofaba australis IT-1 TaxID=1434232 RepID=A0A1Y2K4B3_9PROT|nr:hypothetical protein [Magnetofaba australis]OSM04106.1 putative Protein translocase subunit SecA 2 [Magnetofaba australis IT-1]